MFSGGDSSDGINSLNQFGAYGFVNQVAVSNALAAGQNIDWAQLAQQWIQMRDNAQLEPKTDSEANSNKIVDSGSSNFKFEEKGEADMDMDDEEQPDDKTRRSNDANSSIVNDNLNPAWYFNENSSPFASRSTNNNQWNPWQNRGILSTTLPNPNILSNRPVNPTAHIPSLLKMSVPNPNEVSIMPNSSSQQDNTYVMDAAKRKGLPAWLREGLEKMEREKQKILEKEHQTNKSSDEDNKNIKATNCLNPVRILDEDSSDNEDDVTANGISQKDAHLKAANEEEEDEIYSSIGDSRTYEEKLTELMIVVRHTLTELLLEATNEEISKVADETIKKFKSKASSAQVIRKSALSTLTGKLGLAAYGDSSSESDSETDDGNLSKQTSDQSESDNDSEEELRNVIRQKRRAFIKISEEIEEHVSTSAAQEEEKLKYFLRKEEEEKELSRRKNERALFQDSSTSGHIGHNNFKGYEKDFGEITETKIQYINGKRQKEKSSRRERITRFSDNKDKSVAIPSAATFLTNLNSGTNLISGNATTSTLPTNNQRQNVPDINGLLTNYTSTGVTNALSAADAALEKALKGKASTSPDKQSHRYERDRTYNQSRKRRLSDSKSTRSRSKSSSSTTSSSSSSTSSKSTSSSSRSSHHSKYKRRSAKKHKSHTSDERQYEKYERDHRRDEQKKYSSGSYNKRDHETSSRSFRKVSSDSEDDYRRRHRNYSSYSRNSSHKRSSTSSRYERDREHSRSQSRSSYSSNNRKQ